MLSFEVAGAEDSHAPQARFISRWRLQNEKSNPVGLLFYNIGNCARSGAILRVQKKFSLNKNARFGHFIVDEVNFFIILSR